MKHFLLLFIVVLGAFAVVFGGIPPGYAQEDDDDSDEFQLEDVVVTAMKREQDHQRVPMQMEVISGADLAGTEKDNIDDILRNVSNVMINKDAHGMRVTLRGIADDGRGGVAGTDLSGTTPTVAINVDGAYEGTATAGQNLFDIERVEVLAGPQSTLYSSNSPGGIVNVITAAPKTDRFEVKASTDFGNYGHRDLQAVINVPIFKDKLALRFATQHYQRDSWVVGQNLPQDTETYRVKALYEPNDKISVGLTYSHSTKASGGRLGGTVWLFDYEDGHYFIDDSPVTNPWTSDSYDEGKLGKGVNPDTVPSHRRSDQKTDSWRADIHVETPIGYVSFIPYQSESSKGGIRNDVEVSIGPVIALTTWERFQNQEEKGAELRIASKEDFPFEWIIGGTIYESKSTGYTDDYIYDFNDVDVDINRDNKAFFGNITYPFTDRFRGSAGYRRSWDDARFQEVPPKVKDGITGQEYDEPDYKLGVEYDFSQESMLYANWSTSYRVNTMSDSTEDRPIPPERLDAYAVGVKNRFFNDRIQLNAAAFYYDYRNKRMHDGQDGRVQTRGVIVRESDYPWDEAPFGDPQGTDFNNDGDYNDTNILPAGPVPGPPGTPPSPGPPEGMTSDLVGGFFHDPWESQWGDFEAFGVDISFDAMITPNDLFGLGISYINTEWVDAVDEFYWKGYFSVETEMGEEGRVYNGLKNIYSPEWSVTSRYEHRFDLGNFGMLIPQIDFQYKSDYDLSFRTEYNPWNQQEDYLIWNASIVYRHPSDRWSLRAYVKNIDEYAAKTFYHQAFGGLQDVDLGLSDPRLYGVVFSVNYDR